MNNYIKKILDIRPINIIYVITISFSYTLIMNLLIDILKLNDIFPGGIEVSKKLSDMPLINLIITTIIISPILEEFIFRFLLFKCVNKKVKNYIFSILFSTLMFALLHMNVTQGIYAFFAGIIFSYMYYKFDIFLVPLFMHMMCNATSIIFGDFILSKATLFKDKVFALCLCAVLFIISFYRVIKNSKY